MSTPMMNQAYRVLNALEEGKMIAAISFAEEFGWSEVILRRNLENILKFTPEEIEYWCDYYKIDSNFNNEC